MTVKQLTDAVNDTVSAQWADAITRRAERAIRGESAGHDAEQVLNAITSKLHNMRARGR